MQVIFHYHISINSHPGMILQEFQRIQDNTGNHWIRKDRKPSNGSSCQEVWKSILKDFIPGSCHVHMYSSERTLERSLARSHEDRGNERIIINLEKLISGRHNYFILPTAYCILNFQRSPLERP